MAIALSARMGCLTLTLSPASFLSATNGFAVTVEGTYFPGAVDLGEMTISYAGSGSSRRQLGPGLLEDIKRSIQRVSGLSWQP